MRKVQFTKGNFYHIYNRGVEKRTIFENDNDKWRFLQGLFLFNDETTTSQLLWKLERERGRVTFGVLRDFLKTKGEPREPIVRILADCLMPNHYHLLLEEIKENGISRFMHKLGTGYTEYFNNKYDRVGSLFQGPFKASSIENERYLQYLLVYLNVINHGELIEPHVKELGVKDIKKVMRFAEEYLWGTNQEYLNKRKSIIIEKGLLGELFSDPNYYKEFVESVLIDKKFDEIQDLTLE